MTRIGALERRVAALEDASTPTVYFGDRVRYPSPFKPGVLAFGMVIPRPATIAPTALTGADVVWVIQRNGKIFGIHRSHVRKVL